MLRHLERSAHATCGWLSPSRSRTSAATLCRGGAPGAGASAPSVPVKGPVIEAVQTTTMLIGFVNKNMLFALCVVHLTLLGAFRGLSIGFHHIFKELFPNIRPTN